MDLSTAPVQDQLEAFRRIVLTNPVTAAVVDRLPALGVPDCWLAAGALFQTVWNHLAGREPTAGVRDYDVAYFDPADLGWPAEDRVIGRAAALFADLPAVVEVRNEARVHLWYEDRFGVPCPPYTSTADAIASFPNASSCVAVRRPTRTADGGDGTDRTDGAGRSAGTARDADLEVLAPFGFADLFAPRCRPNPRFAPASVYAAKTARWQAEWPALEVLPWPG